MVKEEHRGKRVWGFATALLS